MNGFMLLKDTFISLLDKHIQQLWEHFKDLN